MTVAKQVPLSISNLLEDRIVKAILDRNQLILPVMHEALSWWGFDLLNRKPSPAYWEDGVLQMTDLDMACFLYTLAERQAVINIPLYTGHSVSRKRKDEVVTSSANRNGKIIGVGVNKDFFSFNVSIVDMNVIGQDYVGKPRTFSLTGKTGEWYEGWREIQFTPTLKENAWISESEILTNNKIYFQNFVHPNRWTSLFGQYYIKTKMLIPRLDEYAAYLNEQVKKMQAAGIKFPPGEGPEKAEYEKPEDGVSKKFETYEFILYTPETIITGTYPELPVNQENLIEAYRTRKKIIYSVIPRLRFMVKATEFAHTRMPDAVPAWFKNVPWEKGFKVPGGRIEWERFKLLQPAVGVQSISILKRKYEKSAKVKADE